MKSWFITVALLLVFSINTNSVYGADCIIKGSETLLFSGNSDHPQEVWDFCVTDDGLIVIPDKIAGNIKLYDNIGRNNLLKLVSTLGTKGFGTDGLLKPMFCSYDKNEGKLAVFDLGRKRVFLYSRLAGRVDFLQESTEIPCDSAYNIKLKDNILYIAGYKVVSDEERYSFYAVDMSKSSKPTYLLSSKQFYGFDTSLQSKSFDDQFESKYTAAIGIMGYFDIQNDIAYVSWQGNLLIHRVNINSGIVDNSIGVRTKNYKNPFLTDELKNAHYDRKDDRILKVKANMSMVKNIFAASNFLLVVFEGPVNVDGKNIWLQKYHYNGLLVGEIAILGQPGNNRYCFDEGALYVLSNSQKEDRNKYVLFKYGLN